MSVTITPTEEYARLRVRDGRRPSAAALVTMTRWLERGAHMKRRHINEPSVHLIVDHDVALRQSFLHAFADSFPNTMPSWLRNTPVMNPRYRVGT